MKVIFLDVDGVLNSEKDLLEAKGKSELFDRPLTLLKELVESTKAKIVVSSTWRIGCSKSGRNSWYGEEIFKTLTDRLAEYQMEVYDITPVINKPGVQLLLMTLQRKKQRLASLRISTWKKKLKMSYSTIRQLSCSGKMVLRQ